MYSDFLGRVVDDLLRRGADHRWIVLFPSKRARLLFLHRWQAVAPARRFPPRAYAWSEFVESRTPWVAAPTEEQLLYLFRAYTGAGERVAFEGFAGWGRVLRSDLEELDRSLVDAERLFRAAFDWERIRNEFSADEAVYEVMERFWATVHQAQNVKAYFLHFWQVMPKVYTEFRAALQNAGRAHLGMMERYVAEDPAHRATVDGPVAVVGFDFPSPAQHRIWRYWQDTVPVTFYWDVPSTYLRLEPLFVRRMPRLADVLRRFPSAMPPPSPSEARLIVHSLPSRSYQLPALFDELGKETDFDSVAVVAPSERLLTSLVRHWPARLPVNVSGGLPVSAGPAFTWIRLLQALREGEGEPGNIPYELYYRLRRHAFLRPLFVEDSSDLEGRRYVPSAALPPPLRRWREVAAPDAAAEVLDELVRAAYDATLSGTPAREAVLWLDAYLAQVRSVLGPASPDDWMEALAAMAGADALPLKGHPLEGVQVMGIYETPALTFREVHLLDMVEGEWPPRIPPSMIPYPIRRAFGMHSTQHRILAHYLHFFRLASHARRVHAYVPQQDGGEPLEPSRLLHLWEGERTTQWWRPEWKTFELRPENLELHPTSEDFRRFREILTGTKGIAPSALNQLRACPRRFLLSVVRRIPEPEYPLPRGMDARVFGTALHTTLETLMSPYLGHPLPDIADKLLQDPQHIHAVVRRQLEAASQGTHGIEADPYLRLMHEAVVRYVRVILQEDRRSAKSGSWLLHRLEQPIQGEVPLSDGAPLRLRGYIDRTVRAPDGARFRIEDYKTGRVDERQLNVADVADLFGERALERGSHEIYFQQVLYAFALGRMTGRPVRPTVWAFRTRAHPLPLPLRVGGEPVEVAPGNAVDSRFEEALRAWVEPMMEAARHEDPHLFAPRPTASKCRYCPFAVACQAP